MSGHVKLCRDIYQNVSIEVCLNKRRNKVKKVCCDNKYFCCDNHSRKMSLTKAATKLRKKGKGIEAAKMSRHV